jgi:NAD(P)-dependent dehydrogenase (short-subunit alcohol dehydrogenase family)
MTASDQVLDSRAAGARRLQGRIAIVTGAGQGIGRATARRFAEEGAVVMIGDRNSAGAERTCKELRHYGAEADVWIGQLGTAEAAKELVAATLQRFGRIDILVNTAGGDSVSGLRRRVFHHRPDPERRRRRYGAMTEG